MLTDHQHFVSSLVITFLTHFPSSPRVCMSTIPTLESYISHAKALLALHATDTAAEVIPDLREALGPYGDVSGQSAIVVEVECAHSKINGYHVLGYNHDVLTLLLLLTLLVHGQARFIFFLLKHSSESATSPTHQQSTSRLLRLSSAPPRAMPHWVISISST